MLGTGWRLSLLHEIANKKTTDIKKRRIFTFRNRIKIMHFKTFFQLLLLCSCMFVVSAQTSIASAQATVEKAEKQIAKSSQRQ